MMDENLKIAARRHLESPGLDDRTRSLIARLLAALQAQEAAKAQGTSFRETIKHK